MDTDNTSRRHGWRSRWAAIGAAVAVSLGGGGFLIADAAAGDDDASYVPIDNCRLFDTRPAPRNIGPKNTPLAAGESNVYTQQVTGTNGNCTIPPDAVGLAMNVTITNPTAQSNLRVFPADQATPLASNLNWLPGQSPTPNKVDVKLSLDGKMKLFNFNGTVNVLADVVGYYTNSTLKELATGLADANAKIATLEAAGRYAKVATTPNGATPSGATLIRGKGIASVAYLGIGLYEIKFDAPIDQCGWFATLNEDATGESQPGEIAVEQRFSNVLDTLEVRTFNSAGTPVDSQTTDGFSVHVTC